ncbi:LapA family protein, partial [Streptococcus thermophilus]|nr:LapA family protein [Streptococcus thermophilus]
KIDKLTAENKQLTLRLNNKGKQKRAVAEQPTTPADK